MSTASTDTDLAVGQSEFTTTTEWKITWDHFAPGAMDPDKIIVTKCQCIVYKDIEEGEEAKKFLELFKIEKAGGCFMEGEGNCNFRLKRVKRDVTTTRIA